MATDYGLTEIAASIVAAVVTYTKWAEGEAEKQRAWQQEENNKDRISKRHYLPHDYKPD